jgi:predicted SAM-dependent methyltransferase
VIGGRLRWHFKELVRTVKRVIHVDNCPSNLVEPANVDYVTDATNLFFAADETLDFVCSSHVLEHVANPLKAIAEWKRVIKKMGIIYAGVPDKRFTFDRGRHRTPLSHLIEDYQKDVDQTDRTHIADFTEKCGEEIAHLLSREQFVGHLRNSPESRVHHHAWIEDDVKEIFEHMGLKILYGPTLHHDTIHIIGEKSNQ